MNPLSAAAVRRCVVADTGYAIISADYDQLELRVAAALAKEQSLIEAAKRGESLHKTTAVQLFGVDHTPDEYRYTKNVNFGWLFGGGAYTLARQAGLPVARAAEIIKQYEEEFKALNNYKRRIESLVLKSALGSDYSKYRLLKQRMQLYQFDTVEGRKLRNEVQRQIWRLCIGKIGYIHTPFGRRLVVDAVKAYTAVNYVVQSASRDIAAMGLLRVMNDFECYPTVLLIIHDELLGQAKIAQAEYIVGRYADLLSTEFLGVPITAQGKVYGRSWGHGYISKSKA